MAISALAYKMLFCTQVLHMRVVYHVLIVHVPATAYYAECMHLHVCVCVCDDTCLSVCSHTCV